MMSKMEFDCKLAHQAEIRRVSGFNSIKLLYEKVSQTFSVPTKEILFCTLNTHNFRDMNSLLGNYLSFGDLIIVHLCGNSKMISVEKTQEYLGLTITDNGIGRAFVKKVKSTDCCPDELAQIKPGDHIAAINGESMVGMRHYEVAKVIREVPRKTTFTLHLIEPLYSNKQLDDRQTRNFSEFQSVNFEKDAAMISLLNLNPETNFGKGSTAMFSSGSPIDNQSSSESSNLDSSLEDLGNSLLPIDKLLSKGAFSNHTITNDGSDNGSYRNKIDKINSILESFLGINDNALAIQIYRLAKDNKNSYNCFTKAIKTSELDVFNFDEDIQSYLWNSAIGLV